MQNMQNNIQPQKIICIIVHCSYFTYSAYTCTSHFADVYGLEQGNIGRQLYQVAGSPEVDLGGVGLAADKARWMTRSTMDSLSTCPGSLQLAGCGAYGGQAQATGATVETALLDQTIGQCS
jgi:hypothetical protein